MNSVGMEIANFELKLGRRIRRKYLGTSEWVIFLSERLYRRVFSLTVRDVRSAIHQSLVQDAAVGLSRS